MFRRGIFGRGTGETGNNRSGWVKRRALPVFVFALLSWFVGDGARAHQDPPTCTAPAITIVFRAFRADKTTPISTAGSVTECENVCFQATLMKGAGTTFCAFSGGTLKITLPDGSQQTVASGTQIPCVGGTTDPCVPGQDRFVSDFVCQGVTTPAISTGGTIGARVDYSGGTSHASVNDVAGVASGMARLTLNVDFCPDDTDCRDNFCDSTLTNAQTGQMGLCTFTNFGSSFLCRAAAGPCDVPEFCDGVNPNCPADAFKPSSTLCRPAAGECDIDDFCPGNGPNCSADAKKGAGTPCTPDGNPCTLDQCDGTSPTCQHPPGNAGTVCRAAAGDCDVAEACSGTSTTCPVDGFKSSATVCRAAAGDCDIPENCTGTSATCPADSFKSSTTVCRAAAGDCDVPENCTGTSATCPADTLKSSSTVCRAAAGDCDVPENCTGSSASCPADGFKSSTTVCRASAGDCDVPENCTGSSASCPADGFKSSATVCRASAGVCDVAENCSGTSATCPGDGFASSTTACRPKNGDCDVPENCTGSSATCPADGFVSSGTICRAAAGDCDVPESCPGNGPNCPADAFSPSTTVCRPACGVCDVPENCPGNGPNCPPDTKKPPGTVCNAACPQVCDGTGCNCPDCPDVGVILTTSTPVINVGDTAVYDIVVTAFGPGTSSNVVLTDNLPNGITWVASGDGPCTIGAGNALSCPFGDMPQGTMKHVTVSAVTNGTSCPLLTDTATVSATIDANPANNSSGPVTITVNCPDVGVNLTTPTPSINAGDTATFVIDVTGNGPGTSHGVVMTAPLPPGLTWVITPAVPGCSIDASNLLTCNLGDVPQGSTTTVTVSAVTSTANCGTISTTAQVTADVDSNPANNTSGPVSITITCPGGCRVTGGGFINGLTDPTTMGQTVDAHFGGQVGAPCGCIGCFDQFGHIQGNWQYNRDKRNASMHAKMFNSLVCGCDGVLNGNVCTGNGPAPPQAPANMVCFSGVADFNPTNGPKTQDVAFRVDAEDRGEPGVNDKLHVRIWVPGRGENAQDLAAAVCCTNAEPQARPPDFDDSGPLIGGNIQIHPELKASTAGQCPKPNGVCTQQ